VRTYIVTQRYVTEETWRVSAQTRTEAIEMTADYDGSGFDGVSNEPEIEHLDEGRVVRFFQAVAKLEPSPNK